MGIAVPNAGLHAEGALPGRVVDVLAVPEPLPSKRFPAVREPDHR